MRFCKRRCGQERQLYAQGTEGQETIEGDQRKQARRPGSPQLVRRLGRRHPKVRQGAHVRKIAHKKQAKQKEIKVAQVV
ncbi:hypothetical protein L596_000518 [Steinernema carpocapsae]|uniref:Uncharacterized protein n=1 Tax=Steinernema carpocapsae TaxID=34508 RepID=A0A4U8UJ74_STECR|nr:hypothetical protein L596_000518 [Steinernema carpocapsae]